MSVAVVIEPGATRSPAVLFIVNAGFVSGVGESSVAIVVEQDVVSPEAAEQIVPAVVVVITHADAGLPTGASDAGFFSDVGEGAVAIIFVEMRRGSCAGRPVGVEARAVS